MDEAKISSKSRLIALLCCFFMGFIGLHRFYVDKKGTGILMILTFGGVGIWVIIDLMMIILGSFQDKEGKIVFKWFEAGSI